MRIRGIRRICHVCIFCIFAIFVYPWCDGSAAIFIVSSVAELRLALITAEDNNENDVINVSSGEYQLTTSLRFDSSEDYSITLQAEDAGVVLKGYGVRVLFLRTTRSNAHITLRGLTLTEGYVPEGDNGAGLFVNIAAGNLLIENCKLLDSFAAAFYFSNHGGGAYITAGSGDVMIRNTVFAGNSAKGLGGGLYLGLISGTLNFMHNTIINNHNKASIPEQGGGIYLRLYYDSVMANFVNNIIYDNTYAHGSSDLYVENDGDGSETGAAVILKNNNYSTLDIHYWTTVVEEGTTSHPPLLSEDFHLLSSSPCIEAGDGSVPDLPPYDFDGEPRILNGDYQGEATPDQGSDEYYMFPQVKTGMVTGITSELADGTGTVATMEWHPILQKGLCWNTAPSPGLLHLCSEEGEGGGGFTTQLAGLAGNTTYYVRSYATNSEDTFFGNEVTFTTSALPTVITAEIGEIYAPNANGGGNVIGPGDSPVTGRGICWAVRKSPDLSDSCTKDGTGTGVFSSTMAGLISGTTYYVRAFATNSQGTAYGNERSFNAIRPIYWPMFTPALKPLEK